MADIPNFAEMNDDALKAFLNEELGIGRELASMQHQLEEIEASGYVYTPNKEETEETKKMKAIWKQREEGALKKLDLKLKLIKIHDNSYRDNLKSMESVARDADISEEEMQKFQSWYLLNMIDVSMNIMSWSQSDSFYWSHIGSFDWKTNSTLYTRDKDGRYSSSTSDKSDENC